MSTVDYNVDNYTITELLEIVGLDTRLDNQMETVLYRVIQEIVNNIIKHARASQISMQLIRHETELNIIGTFIILYF